MEGDHNSIASAIKRIRKALGQNQAAFASTLGIRQGTISQYEAGKVFPSLDVLTTLHRLCPEGPDRRLIGDFISARTGHTPASFEHLMEPDARRRQITRLGGRSSAEWQRFLDEVGRLSEQGRDVDPYMTQLIQLYREHRFDSRMNENLRRAVAWLEVELAAPHAGRRPMPHTEGARRVMIRCPQTGREVFTRMTATPTEWETADVRDAEVLCTECLTTHWWNKSDAFLGDPI